MSDAPWMTAARFDASLDLLPEALRERALELRPYLFGARRDREVAESVELAFDAAYLRDEAAATAMLERAEARVASIAPKPSPGARPPAPSPTAKPRTVMMGGLRGRVAGGPDAAPLVAATDASAKKGARRRRDDFLGWAYITGHGHWGCGGRIFEGRLNPHRYGASLSGELRAVHMLLGDLGREFGEIPPMTVLIDSQGAIGFLRRWRAGHVDVMPEGYSLRPRHGPAAGDGKPTLVRLAEAVASHPQLTFEHVAGHSGHPLNEAADGLARFARACLAGERTGDRAALAGHASGLAAAFLAAWRDQGGPLPAAPGSAG